VEQQYFDALDIAQTSCELCHVIDFFHIVRPTWDDNQAIPIEET